MQAKIFILLIILLLTEYGYSQFFQHKLEGPKLPGKVLETDEFIYVSQLYRNTAQSELNQIFIQKFDKSGKHNSSFRVDGNKGCYELFSTNDNSIMLIMTEGTSDSPKIKAVKFDKHLNKIWEKFIPADNQNFSAVYKDSDGSIYMATYYSQNYSVIRKLNSDAEQLWKSDSIPVYMTSFSKVNDFYLGFSDQMFFRISNSFTIDFNLTVPYQILDNVIIDNSVFLSMKNKRLLFKYDQNGNFIDSINFSYPVLHLSKTVDNHFLITLFRGVVMKYNASENLIWSIDSPDLNYTTISKAFSLADNSILFYIDRLDDKYLVKGTQNGDYKFIRRYFGIAGTGFNYTSTLSWYATNIDKTDLSYFDYLGNEIYLAKEYQTVPELNRFQFEVPKNLRKILIKDHQYEGISDSIGFDELERCYPHYDFLSINNISMWIADNGTGAQDPFEYNFSSTWRSLYDSVKSVIFVDGLHWGGIVEGNILVNGSRFWTGLKAGNIINGKAADPSTKNYSPFKIRKDWQSLPDGIERDNYKFCYNNWPAHLGADWIDRNADGFYTSGIDEPMFSGDEVLFYVANDLDTSRVNYATGCDPIGLEFQTTVYGFDSTNFLADVVFKKYVMINKSGKEIKDMYFCYFADMADGDDFTGCDSSLNLGYSWNMDNYDEWGFGYEPPAAGHMIVQGPIIASIETDKAKFKGEWRNGYRNLPLTAFGPDWNMEIGERHEDAIVMYNYIFKGLNYNSRIPQDYINPHTGVKTLFPLSGDPESGTGWYEGAGWPGGVFSGGRMYWLTSGPITMAPSDTQEVVIAILAAQGTSHLNSVTKLKEKARLVQEFYNQFTMDSPNERPTNFALHQNYPNPFNNKTTIRYSLKDQVHVRIKLYDILGCEITTLVNEEKVPWTYEVNLNASNLASGVYIYRIEAGSFIQSKKMILLK